MHKQSKSSSTKPKVSSKNKDEASNKDKNDKLTRLIAEVKQKFSQPPVETRALLIPEFLSSAWHQVDFRLNDTLGPNILHSSKENPSNLALKSEDIGVFFNYAEQLYHHEVAAFNRHIKSHGDGELRSKLTNSLDWIKKLDQRGTMRDKLTAKAMLVKHSPAHNLDALEALVKTALKEKSKREAQVALSLLEKIWLDYMLPDDRKLVLLRNQNLLSDKLDDKHLLFFYIENRIKFLYSDYIKAIEYQTQENDTPLRRRALRTASILLSRKLENEKIILNLIINKLSDKETKVASFAMGSIRIFTQKNPLSCPSVVYELSQYFLRPGISTRSKQYAVCLTLDFKLNEHTTDLANLLITFYFDIFTRQFKDEDLRGKLLNAILAGINRTIIYSNLPRDIFEKHHEAMRAIAEHSDFSSSVQALHLLFQLSIMSPSQHYQQSAADRYYKILYIKLQLLFSEQDYKSQLFFNLLYKSMTLDKNIDRVKAFVKRLLQLSLTCIFPNVTIAILILISAVAAKHGDAIHNYFDLEKHQIAYKQRCEISEDKKSFVDLLIPAELAKQKSDWSTLLLPYQPTHPDPLKSNAESAYVWELSFLTKHAHPVIAGFAKQLLTGTDAPRITYDGDPLEAFSTINFLNIFICRKPKNRDHIKSKTTKDEILKIRNKELNNKLTLFQSEEFSHLDISQVPHQERFIHAFSQTPFELLRRSATIDTETLLKSKKPNAHLHPVINENKKIFENESDKEDGDAAAVNSIGAGYDDHVTNVKKSLKKTDMRKPGDSDSDSEDEDDIFIDDEDDLEIHEQLDNDELNSDPEVFIDQQTGDSNEDEDEESTSGSEDEEDVPRAAIGHSKRKAFSDDSQLKAMLPKEDINKITLEQLENMLDRELGMVGEFTFSKKGKKDENMLDEDDQTLGGGFVDASDSDTNDNAFVEFSDDEDLGADASAADMRSYGASKQRKPSSKGKKKSEMYLDASAFATLIEEGSVDKEAKQILHEESKSVNAPRPARKRPAPSSSKRPPFKKLHK